MGTYIVLIIMTVIIAAFVKKQENGAGVCILTRQQACNYVCFLAIFLLLFGVSACRYQVGNDYSRYEEFFHLIPLGEVVPTEFGFNAVVLAMQFLFGRDTKLSIFALFAFVTVCFMMKAVYDQSIYDFELLFPKSEYSTLLSGLGSGCIFHEIYAETAICQIYIADCSDSQHS